MVVLIAIIAISLSLCGVALANGWIQPETIRDLVERSGPYAILTYIVAVVVIELLWMPRMWGLMAGGILFGPVLGGLLSIAADMLGASACYVLSRTGGREWLESLLVRRPRVARIVDLLAVRKGILTMTLLRATPIGHYTTVSYAAGLAGVRPAPYLVGTFLGILPGAALYPLLGDSMLTPTEPTFWITLAIIIAVLVLTFVIGRRMLDQKSDIEI